jgi:hypothetical protein
MQLVIKNVRNIIGTHLQMKMLLVNRKLVIAMENLEVM